MSHWDRHRTALKEWLVSLGESAPDLNGSILGQCVAYSQLVADHYSLDPESAFSLLGQLRENYKAIAEHLNGDSVSTAGAVTANQQIVVYLKSIFGASIGGAVTNEEQMITQLESDMPWTPEQILDVTLIWTDPSNSDNITEAANKVSNLEDDSNNSYNIGSASGPEQPTTNIRTIPVIDGLNVIDFDGVNQKLWRTTDGPYARNVGSVMCAIVAQSDNPSKVSAELFQIRGGGDLARCFFQTYNGNWAVGGRRLDGGGFQRQTFDAVDSDPHVCVFIIDYDNAQVNFSLDGTLNTALAFQTPGKTADTDSKSMGQGVQNSERFDGGIGEMIVTEDDITTDTRQKLEGYLSHKYSLSANLPVGHPYKASAP